MLDKEISILEGEKCDKTTCKHYDEEKTVNCGYNGKLCLNVISSILSKHSENEKRFEEKKKQKFEKGDVVFYSEKLFDSENYYFGVCEAKIKKVFFRSCTNSYAFYIDKETENLTGEFSDTELFRTYEEAKKASKRDAKRELKMLRSEKNNLMRNVKIKNEKIAFIAKKLKENV